MEAFLVKIFLVVQRIATPQQQIAATSQCLEMRECQYPGLHLPTPRIVLFPLLENGQKDFLGNVLGF